MLHGTKALIALTVFTLSTLAHASPKTPRPKDLKNAYHEKMEAIYCAPGMPCYDSKMQSQLDLLIPVAGFGAKAADPRKAMKRIKGSEEGKSGLIRNETLRGEASVSLVGECYALTNAHAVVGVSAPGKKNAPVLKGWPKDRSAIDKVRFTLKFGQKVPKGFETELSGKVAAIGDFDPTSPDQREDWALIQLEKCIGKDSEYGHYPITPVAFEYAERLENRIVFLSHPGDKDAAAGVQVQEGCGNVLETEYPREAIWGHNCISWERSSGGALAARNVKTKKLHMIAMNTFGASIWYNEGDYNIESANGAISMAHIYPKIKSYIEGQQVASLEKR